MRGMFLSSTTDYWKQKAGKLVELISKITCEVCKTINQEMNALFFSFNLNLLYLSKQYNTIQ